MSYDYLLGFIKASKYRILILSLLNEKLYIPCELAVELKTSQSQVSRTLKELLKNGLVTCNTPTRNKGKLYGISDIGVKLLELNGGIN
jgi:DNA-binding transcriptional ArsR family regulator